MNCYFKSNDIVSPPQTKIIRKRTKNTLVTQKKSSLICHINLDISEYWRIIDVTCMSQWKSELFYLPVAEKPRSP